MTPADAKRLLAPAWLAAQLHAANMKPGCDSTEDETVRAFALAMAALDKMAAFERAEGQMAKALEDMANAVAVVLRRAA